LQTTECKPGAPAPASGWYEPLNIFGTPDGQEAFVEQGHRTPLAPVGYLWRLKRAPLSALPAVALLERAAELRAMAATARTLGVADALLRLADRFALLAAQPAQAQD
jgi:hypothetical protein